MTGGGAAALVLTWFMLVDTNALSHRKTCMKIGTLACRCKDNFWLSETVSKHRTAPVEETIHGRTFWFDTLDTTSSLDVSIPSLYRSLTPDRLEGTLSSPSITDEM